MDRADLALLSAALTAVCVVPYLRDVRRGTTRPHRASWLVFALLSLVAAASQTLDGAGPGAWLAAGSALGFTLVFIASVRHGVGGFATSDRVALGIAAVGTGISVATAEPLIAVASVVAAELAAVALTARKAFVDPASETLSTWLLDCLAGAVAIVAVERLSTADLLYPLHHTVANAAVVVAILAGRRRSRLRPADVPAVGSPTVRTAPPRGTNAAPVHGRPTPPGDPR